MNTNDQTDEAAIRAIIQEWLEATKRRDFDRVLEFAHEDLIFHVANAEPFDKAVFARSGGLPQDVSMNGSADIVEVEVCGDLGYARTWLDLTITSPPGKVAQHAGWAIGIFRRNADGHWQLWRDANFVKQVTI